MPGLAPQFRKLNILFSCLQLKNRLYPFYSLLLIILSPFFSTILIAQTNCVCAYCGYKCGTGHAANCKYSNNGSSSNSSSSSSTNWFQVHKEEREEQKLSNATQYNNKGIEEYKKQNWSEALKYFKKALRNNPDDNVIKQNLKNAEDNYKKEADRKKANEEWDKTAKIIQENQRKLLEEQKLKEAEQQQAAEKAKKEAIEKKLDEAEQKIESLQKDISGIQKSLKVYSKSLQNNTVEFEKWASTVDESYNDVIKNSKEYLAKMFIKYNLMGALRPDEQKEIYAQLRKVLGSSNPELQKWLTIESNAKGIDLDKLQDVIDRVNLGGDLSDLLNDDKEHTSKNLDVLLFANSLIETMHLNKYEAIIKTSKPFGALDMPGEYFDQAKMIGETYADLSSICYSWFMIRKLSNDNDAFALNINSLSYRMQYEMKEIDCLKKCKANYTTGCIEHCTGVTRFGSPPPLLR